jgi:hypothetical protein
LTWPYHCSLFFSMMSGFPFTPIISFICSFFILSLLHLVVINFDLMSAVVWYMMPCCPVELVPLFERNRDAVLSDCSTSCPRTQQFL